MRGEVLLWHVPVNVLRASYGDYLIADPVVASGFREHPYLGHHRLSLDLAHLGTAVPCSPSSADILGVAQGQSRDSAIRALFLEFLSRLIGSVGIAHPIVHLLVKHVEVQEVQDHLPFSELRCGHDVLLHLSGGGTCDVTAVTNAALATKGAKVLVKVRGKFAVDLHRIREKTDDSILDQLNVRWQNVYGPQLQELQLVPSLAGRWFQVDRGSDHCHIEEMVFEPVSDFHMLVLQATKAPDGMVIAVTDVVSKQC